MPSDRASVTLNRATQQRLSERVEALPRGVTISQFVEFLLDQELYTPFEARAGVIRADKIHRNGVFRDYNIHIKQGYGGENE